MERRWLSSQQFTNKPWKGPCRSEMTAHQAIWSRWEIPSHPEAGHRTDEWGCKVAGTLGDLVPPRAVISELQGSQTGSAMQLTAASQSFISWQRGGRGAFCYGKKLPHVRAFCGPPLTPVHVFNTRLR